MGVCNPACTRVCGDADQDGRVTISDLHTVNDLIFGRVTFDACQRWSADVDNDGAIGLQDYLDITDLVVAGTTGTGCAP